MHYFNRFLFRYFSLFVLSKLGLHLSNLFVNICQLTFESINLSWLYLSNRLPLMMLLSMLMLLWLVIASIIDLFVAVELI
jgi:hypothetical protein